MLGVLALLVLLGIASSLVTTKESSVSGSLVQASICEVLEHPEFYAERIIKVNATYEGSIIRPNCFPLYALPTQSIVRSGECAIEVKGVVNAEVGNATELRATVKVYEGMVGCEKGEFTRKPYLEVI